MVVVKLSPGSKATFMVNEGAIFLVEEERKGFHLMTVKLLNFAKWARPVILMAVSLLCMGVQATTTEDQSKLAHVFRYLKGTQDRTLLHTQGGCLVWAYVDVAYALHPDSKSHSGEVIFVAWTLVYVSSRKQKCTSKSPMEAEMIALTDNLGLIELFHEFAEFTTGWEVEKPAINQDCMAIISLVTKGGGITRTKHLHARMNLRKELVDEK